VTPTLFPAPTPQSDQSDRSDRSDRAEAEGLLYEGRTALRRRDRLRDLFRRHGKLTRQEITRLLGVSGPTATADLKALCAEELIERVTPSLSRRSHYFALKSLGLAGPAAR